VTGDQDLKVEGVPPEHVEAVLRAYRARAARTKIARTYAPLAIGLAALLAVVLAVPTVSPGERGAAGFARGTGNVGGEGAALQGSTGSAGGVPGAPGSGASASTTGQTLGANSVSGGLTAGTQAALFSTNQARSGVTCGGAGAGRRQVTWSVYAPPCVPAFRGANGGATSQGVTATTITAVFRRTNSAEEKAAFAAAGSAAPGTDDQYLYDLRTYIEYFSKSFETYGRHLVVKDFDGVGDNLEEDQGRDLQGAESDAATAQQMGAFMDLSSSPTLASTQPYEEDLAAHHVIAIGAVGLPKSWFRHYAPYEYSIAPDGTSGVQAGAHALCERENGLPAIYAGDPTFRTRTRTFGLITPDNPVYVQLGDELSAEIKAECNAKFDKRVSYSINVLTETQQSVNIIAQMNAAHITSLACLCDPIVEIDLTNTADSQRYYPEWGMTPWLDPQGRESAQDQMAHAGAGQWIAFPPKSQSEAYRVFKLARPTVEPREMYYVVAYWTALYVFDLLQLAGPNLTPATFQRAAFGMPDTGAGMFGTWGGGPEAYSPTKTVQLQHWDQNATSNMDGKQGAWVACEGGHWYNIYDPATFAPAHTQFKC